MKLFASVLLLVVIMSFSIHNDESSKDQSFLTINFEGYKNQIFGKTHEVGQFVFFSAFEDGRLWDGNYIGFFKDNIHEGLFSLDGANRFVFKTVDGSDFSFVSFIVSDPYKVSNNIFIEGFYNGNLIATQEVVIGDTHQRLIQLDDKFANVDEVRFGSNDGAGVWNYFDDFHVGVTGIVPPEMITSNKN